MQNKYIILPIILSLFSLLSAGPPDTLWTRTYGGDSSDAGTSVQQTSDGGFIVTGYTTSFGAGGDDVYLIRTDSNGDTLWTKTYGGIEDDIAKSIQETSDGGFIITGSTASYGAGEFDVYLIRTNSEGDTLWTKTFGGDSTDYGNSSYQTNDSGFIIVGQTRSFGSGMNDIYLIRTDSNGDTLWTKIYGGTKGEVAYSFQQTSDGGYIIVGETFSYGAGGWDVYLIRTNSNGDTLWTKNYGGTDHDRGYSIQQTNDGGFIISGFTMSFGIDAQDVYILRTNNNGDTLWTRTYGGDKEDEGFSIQWTSDSGFIIVGYTQSFGAGGNDVYIIKINANGDTLWTKTCGGIDRDWGYSVQETNDGGYVIAGYTSPFGADGYKDVYLIRLDKDSTGIQEDNPFNFLNPNDFIVSYNHGNISIRYTIPYSTSVKLEAYDIRGKLVKVITDKFMHKGSYTVNWDSKRFGSGIYFLKLSANGSSVSKKFTIIK